MLRSTTASVEGERRLATVLFADISGFTRLSEQLDPEELTLVVNDCFNRIAPIIEKHEGLIDKYIGDCIMALFGIPKAIEAAPRKALDAAFEMQQAIRQYNASGTSKYKINLHIGINTGMVLAGPIGAENLNDFTVMGDTVNIASRLKDISSIGQIFVGPKTFRQTKNFFSFKKLEPIDLKGKEQSLTIYELIARHEDDIQQTYNNRMIFSEMIGREQQLDQLVLHLFKVINREGSIVSISGEAGIGKSRLIRELNKREEVSKVTFISGRALSYGQNLSYHPIIDVLRKWLNIKENDSEYIAHRKLEKGIRNIDPQGVEEIVPFIARLMGMHLNGKYRQRLEGIEGDALVKLMIKTCRELIMKASSVRPVVIVMDDMQWADMSSIELLKILLRLADKHPILFVFAFRPDDGGVSAPLMDIIRKNHAPIHHSIQLVALEESFSAQLINNLLRADGFPSHVTKQIVQRSGGNPFFIEEIVRSLIDEGIVLYKNGNFVVSEKIHSVHIPETITEVLMSRIDKLGPQARELIKTASVIGRNFFSRILKEVIEAPEGIGKQLAYLEDIQLIKKQQRMDEMAYMFKHALAQEATYESILLKTRKELHIRTAKAFEKVFAERLPEFYGMLALHYSKGEDLDKAEEYLIKAGEESLNASASSEALVFYKDALGIYLRKNSKNVDHEKVALLEKNIGLAFQNKGQFADAVYYIDHVLRHYGVRVPRSRMEKLITFMSGFVHLMFSLYMPRYKWTKTPNEIDLEVIRLSFIKLNCVGVMDPKRLVPEAFKFYRLLTSFDLTKIDMGSGMFSGASVLFTIGGVSFKFSRKVLDVIKAQIIPGDVKSQMYYGFADILDHYHSGHWDLAEPYDKQLVEDALNLGQMLPTTYYVHSHALLNIKLGNYDTTIMLIEALRDLGEKFEHSFATGLSMFSAALLHYEFRELDKALLAAQQAIEFLHKIDDWVYLFRVYSLKANIQLRMGEVAAAKASLEKVKGIKLDNPLPSFKIDYLESQLTFDVMELEQQMLKVSSGMKAQLFKKARRSGRAAYRVSHKVARSQPIIFQHLGTISWLAGQPAKAVKWWKKSMQTGERLGTRIELARIYMEIGGKMLSTSTKEILGHSMDEYFDRSRSIFEEYALSWDLRELESLKLY